MNILPSTDYLRECFLYEPLTGKLIWRRRPLAHFRDVRVWKMWNTRFAEKESGVLEADRYRRVGIDGNDYKTHRIIFKLMTGREPDQEIDHRNEIKHDNRWENLREATHQQNVYNQGVNKKNACGLKGAWLYKKSNKFTAAITINGRYKHLGYFKTAEEAHQAYGEAARALHGDFANIGIQTSDYAPKRGEG